MTYKRTEISRSAVEAELSICSRIRTQLEADGATRFAMVDTYGCQQNEADSQHIRGYLSAMGYAFTNDENIADVIVINTCAIREHAEMRVLGNVGALVHTKRRKPEQIICLCGCSMQQEHMKEKIRKSFRHVDLVFGPHALWRFPEFMEKLLTEKGRIFEIAPDEGAIAEGMPALRDGKVKAWLSIMYGCNNFCSYCIVPYVRGRERSRTPEEIIIEAKQLIADGYKDITLLGQNVNSYGKDLESGTDFSDLLVMLNELDGDFVLRFMTSHPKDATEKLYKTMSECSKVENHIHLPLQAGNDRVLKAMNRVYDSEKYLSLVDCARKYMPDIVLTTDIIVGFPGETDEEFEDTLKIIEKVRFDAMFTFIFSPRTGTPAAEMADPFTKQEKQARFDRLLKLANKISEGKHAEYIGKTVSVLVDGVSDDETYKLTARTRGGRLVHLDGDISLMGQFVQAEIFETKIWAMFGRVV